MPTMASASPAVAGRVQLDSALMRAMEDLFTAGEAILIAAFHVHKVKAAVDTTGARLMQALGGGAKAKAGAASVPAVAAAAAPEQRRVLCLTVRRSKSEQRGAGFRPALHVVKQGDDGRYQISRTVALKQVLELAAPAQRVERPGVDQRVLRITLGAVEEDVGDGANGADADGGSKQARGAGTAGAASVASSATSSDFGMRGEVQLMLCVALIVQLLRQHVQGRVPRLVGLTAEDVERWWDLHQDTACAALGDFVAEVLMPGLAPRQANHAALGGGGARVLVSAKEEGDLEELLDMFAMGIGDVADFERKLTAEHQAHEAANVHTILANAPMVDAVMAQLRRTQLVLAELDDNLAVFDAKLHTMRDDIAAIEKSNNTLELQARNNGALLTALQELLEAVKPPPELASALDTPAPFEGTRVTSVVAAGWLLHQRLQRLTPGVHGALSAGLLRMRVVIEAREGLAGLAGRFVAKAATHLGSSFAVAVDEVVHEVVAISKNSEGAGRRAPPDHSRIRTLCARHSQVMRLMRALDPSVLPTARSAYSTAMNTLFRKELRLTVGELRKAATADMHNNPIDYSLTKEQPGAGPHGPAASSKAGSSDDASSYSGAASMRGGGVPGMGGLPSLATMSRQSHGSNAPSSVGTRGRGMHASMVGDVAPMSLNDAFALLLDNYIPFLAAEADAAATYLMLHRGRSGGPVGALDSDDGDEEGGGPQGPSQMARSESKRRSRRKAAQDAEEEDLPVAGTLLPGSSAALTGAGEALMEAMMSGIEAELQVLVDLTMKSHQVICLPMLAATTRWLAQLAGRPSALCLARALSACHERLRTNLGAFVSQQLTAIEQYDTKRILASGVKAVHVLAFIRQFALMAHHMEILLGQCATILPSPAAAQGLVRSLSKRSRAVGARDAERSSEEEEEAAPITTAASVAAHKSIIASATWQVRSEVDSVYKSLVGAMFATLERAARSDPKHGDRLRMENYGYFAESVRPLVRHVGALEPYMVQAEARQEESTVAYVGQQLDYSKLGKLLEWSSRLSKLLDVSSPEEVAFQAGFSAADAKSMMAGCLTQVDKTLAAMYSRIRKHVGGSTLAYRVWGRVQEQLITRYGALEEQRSRCYPSLSLTPDPQELQHILAAVATGGHRNAA